MSRYPSLAERIEARTDRSGGPEACHIWTGNKSQWSTPSICSGRRSISARRAYWEIVHGGKLPAKKWVTTTCKNLLCMNAKHLTLRTTRDDTARFFEKVDKNGPNGCWLWTGYVEPRGYGRFSPLGGESTKGAHRVSWEMVYGPIPTDGVELCVCHHCDNPRCVNPAHLFLGTDADNQRDCVAKGRKASGPRLAEAIRAARAKKREAMSDLSEGADE